MKRMMLCIIAVCLLSLPVVGEVITIHDAYTLDIPDDWTYIIEEDKTPTVVSNDQQFFGLFETSLLTPAEQIQQEQNTTEQMFVTVEVSELSLLSLDESKDMPRLPRVYVQGIDTRDARFGAVAYTFSHPDTDVTYSVIFVGDWSTKFQEELVPYDKIMATLTWR